MKIEKRNTLGYLGKTVLYSIPIRFTETTLEWDSFLFYSPNATLIDSDGNRYFEVEKFTLELTRDDLDIIFSVYINETGIFPVGVYSGVPPCDVGNGDMVILGRIPAIGEIEIVYKEVTNG